MVIFEEGNREDVAIVTQPKKELNPELRFLVVTKAPSSSAT